MIETFSSKVSKREWQALNGGGETLRVLIFSSLLLACFLAGVIFKYWKGMNSKTASVCKTLIRSRGS